MPHSTESAPVSKPQKPQPDFPLVAHGNGQWAKKFRGKRHYFGSWREDPTGAAALERFEIIKLRGIFRYGHEEKLYPQPVDYGTQFKTPSAKTLRRAKNHRCPKLFHREEIRRMLETPNLALRAMI